MTQTSNLLDDAITAIRTLRRANIEMREKLDLVEGMLELRHLQGPSKTMGPDIISALYKASEEFRKKENKTI